MYPKEILKITKQCEEQYTNDLAKAKKAAVRKIRKLSIFPEFVDMLVESAVDGIVDEARHKRSVAITRGTKRWQ